MTIGEKVAEAFNIPLFHNHVTLDAIWPYIGWNETTFELSEQLRMGIFDYISKSQDHPGIVFTFVWNFDNREDWAYVNQIKEKFKKGDGEMYFIELEADLTERLRRNETEKRLSVKPSKRNIEFSRQELLHSADKHRLNSLPGEIQEANYLKMDVTEMSAEKVSETIIEWIRSR